MNRAPVAASRNHLGRLLLALLHLLNDRHLNSLRLRQGHHGLGTLADNKHVRHTSGEFVASGILDVANVEGTLKIRQANGRMLKTGTGLYRHFISLFTRFTFKTRNLAFFETSKI